ncbi:MAG: LytTR family DNA-binding domain-containing protein [Pseudomonadota bacterium]
MTYSVFVVDDESMARGNLLDSLQRHAAWQRPRCFVGGEGLLAAVQAECPQVIFLDIQMPGDDGMTLAREILQLPEAPLIVFVTAHSEYAVAAFELYAVDYLLKPFSDERLTQCLGKLEQALASPAAVRDARCAQNAWAASSPLERLVIKSATSVRIVEVTDIDWLAANGNYVDIHHTDGTHLLRASLKQVLASLPEAFVQIHRGYAVRFSLIREVHSVDSDRSEVVLRGGQVLPLGKLFRKVVLARLYESATG